MFVEKIKKLVLKVIRKNNIENKKNLKKIFLEEKNLENKDRGVTNIRYFDEEIIISLTSYGIRVNMVYLVIESLFQQIVKANKIILWLDEAEFTKLEELPIALIRMQERGLEIKFYKNIRSYKKLIPTLKEYSDQIIITVDDDIMYPIDFIEKLLNNYKKNPNRIYYYRGHSIQNSKKGVLPYKQWMNKESENLLLNFPTGIGGILYPPNCFCEEVTKEEIFMKICPYGDDIWFKVMSLLKGIECEKIKITEKFEEKFLSLEELQEISLSKKNLDDGFNDKQIKKVFEYYNILEKIKE